MPYEAAKSPRNRFYTVLGVVALVLAPLLAEADTAGEPGRQSNSVRYTRLAIFGHALLIVWVRTPGITCPAT
jgi:hypothetical protein